LKVHIDSSGELKMVPPAATVFDDTAMMQPRGWEYEVILVGPSYTGGPDRILQTTRTKHRTERVDKIGICLLDERYQT